MKSPGFWISRHPSPDALILGAEEVNAFNQKLVKDGLTKDLFNIDAFDLNISRTQIQNEIKKFEHGDYFDREGKLVSRDLFKSIKENLNIDDVKDIVPRHAFVARQSDQRLLPTDAILTAEPFDLEFDEVQNSSLDVGNPVVVFYETLDEKWAYTQASASAGWVKKENLAFVSSDEFKNLLSSEKFVVVTAAKADLYLDEARTKYYDYVRMGTRLALLGGSGDVDEVEIAPGQNLFISQQDVHSGFLSYTPRHIIEQAFKMLNEPYGWGGMNGEQDCSAFLKGVFATVGLDLPRNSGEQGRTGKLVKNLSDALPGITVAQMKGHIVLYLGTYDDRFFAIHEAYAYREPQRAQAGEPVEGEDRARVFNRVAVSDLNLGKGSKKGSLLERIVSVREYR
ncbi:MAG: SH3 domain-containing protein [Candidatus Omnitrophica bacterium]|nr:SH3 domain-containing protein [Candidatus Omnitrophota bacterium]